VRNWVFVRRQPTIRLCNIGSCGAGPKFHFVCFHCLLHIHMNPCGQIQNRFRLPCLQGYQWGGDECQRSGCFVVVGWTVRLPAQVSNQKQIARKVMMRIGYLQLSSSWSERRQYFTPATRTLAMPPAKHAVSMSNMAMLRQSSPPARTSARRGTALCCFRCAALILPSNAGNCTVRSCWNAP